MDKFFEVRCKAFTGENKRLNLVMVSADGTIRVWDSMSNYYTTCHSLSVREAGMIRQQAKTL